MSEDRFARIEEKLDVLVAGQAGLEAGQTTLTTGQATLQAGQARIEARLDKVEITQEAMRDDIKQIAEGHGATQAAIERATEVVCAHIDKRIKPIEDMARVHFGTR